MSKPKPVATHVARNLKHQHQAGLAADVGVRQHDAELVHAPRAPPPPRLIGKAEVTAKTSLSYAMLWRLMCQKKFPRSRIVGGRVVWLESEIDEWISKLPVQPLKGDRGKRTGRGAHTKEHRR